MTHALAARCVALLGSLDGPLLVAGPHAPRITAALPAGTSLADEGQRAGAAIVSFLGAGDGPAARQSLLVALRARMVPGAPLVLVDHNQPRAWWRRAVATVVLALRGLPPARGRYPAARELAVLGLDVERLRLACGERVQLVVARCGATELVVPPGSK